MRSLFDNLGPFTLREIAKKLDCSLSSGEDIIITGINTLEKAGPSELTFLTNMKYSNALKTTKAGACLVDKNFKLKEYNNCIHYITSDTLELSYALVLKMFYKEMIFDKEKISKGAYIHSSVKLGKNIIIGHGSYIGKNCEIGDNTIIENNVSIVHSKIGENCRISNSCSIGQESLGYTLTQGKKEKKLQLGSVIIKDFVEIGANTTIDRGSIDDTVIQRGTKIGNLVVIAHNVKIGEDCIIISQTGIAGSVKIGNNVVIAGQAGIAGHINIGNNVMIAAKSGVTKNIKENKIVAGYPATEIIEWKRRIAKLKRLAKK